MYTNILKSAVPPSIILYRALIISVLRDNLNAYFDTENGLPHHLAEIIGIQRIIASQILKQSGEH